MPKADIKTPAILPGSLFEKTQTKKNLQKGCKQNLIVILTKKIASYYQLQKKQRFQD